MVTKVKDYYAVLSLSQSATQQQIRSRFLELARERHPDLFRGPEKDRAENEFQDITEAFNVLSNPERRRLHDIEVTQPTPSVQASSPKQTAKTFLQRGSRAFREGRYKDATQDFERATRVAEGNATAWYNLALAASREPSLRSKALSAVAKACELDKMNVNYLKLAGKLFVDSGMPLRAERYYRQALKWAGQDPDLHAALDQIKRSK